MSEMADLLNLGSKTPAFRIVIEGKDATQTLDKRLLGMTLTDNRGFEADQLDLELDDADGLVIMPRRGAVISLALGWKGEPLYSKGQFTVDEIEHSGSPDRLTIRARSADFRETLNVRREKSWHKTTVGDVVKDIAARHSLKVAIGNDVAAMALDHLDQTNESDASFLMKLRGSMVRFPQSRTVICCLSGRGRGKQQVVNRCLSSLLPVRTETVTGLAWLTGEHIRVLSLTGCIPGNRKRKKLQR